VFIISHFALTQGGGYENLDAIIDNHCIIFIVVIVLLLHCRRAGRLVWI
jgi:hypothetical protein